MSCVLNVLLQLESKQNRIIHSNGAELKGIISLKLVPENIEVSLSFDDGTSAVSCVLDHSEPSFMEYLSKRDIIGTSVTLSSWEMFMNSLNEPLLLIKRILCEATEPLNDTVSTDHERQFLTVTDVSDILALKKGKGKYLSHIRDNYVQGKVKCKSRPFNLNGETFIVVGLEDANSKHSLKVIIRAEYALLLYSCLAVGEWYCFSGLVMKRLQIGQDCKSDILVYDGKSSLVKGCDPPLSGSQLDISDNDNLRVVSYRGTVTRIIDSSLRLVELDGQCICLLSHLDTLTWSRILISCCITVQNMDVVCIKDKVVLAATYFTSVLFEEVNSDLFTNETTTNGNENLAFMSQKELICRYCLSSHIRLNFDKSLLKDRYLFVVVTELLKLSGNSFEPMDIHKAIFSNIMKYDQKNLDDIITNPESFIMFPSDLLKVLKSEVKDQLLELEDYSVNHADYEFESKGGKLLLGYINKSGESLSSLCDRHTQILIQLSESASSEWDKSGVWAFLKWKVQVDMSAANILSSIVVDSSNDLKQILKIRNPSKRLDVIFESSKNQLMKETDYVAYFVHVSDLTAYGYLYTENNHQGLKQPSLKVRGVVTIHANPDDRACYIVFRTIKSGMFYKLSCDLTTGSKEMSYCGKLEKSNQIKPLEYIAEDTSMKNLWNQVTLSSLYRITPMPNNIYRELFSVTGKIVAKVLHRSLGGEDVMHFTIKGEEGMIMDIYMSFEHYLKYRSLFLRNSYVCFKYLLLRKCRKNGIQAVFLPFSVVHEVLAPRKQDDKETIIKSDTSLICNVKTSGYYKICATIKSIDKLSCRWECIYCKLHVVKGKCKKYCDSDLQSSFISSKRRAIWKAELFMSVSDGSGEMNIKTDDVKTISSLGITEQSWTSLRDQSWDEGIINVSFNLYSKHDFINLRPLVDTEWNFLGYVDISHGYNNDTKFNQAFPKFKSLKANIRTIRTGKGYFQTFVPSLKLTMVLKELKRTE